MLRNQTLDVTKGIGILLVVLGHNWAINHASGIVFRIIFSFHMALFFLLAGVLFRPEDRFSSILKSKFSTLLKPYLVVAISLGLAHALLEKTSVMQSIGAALYGTGSTLVWTPMWFLPHLFVLFVLARFLGTIYKGLFASRPLIVFVIILCWRQESYPSPLSGGYLYEKQMS
ncbi:MAG: acyltransferase 3 [Rhodocyclales bacterium]|nr:acyltransferase 3 [Rhodocyclales bacterium]